MEHSTIIFTQQLQSQEARPELNISCEAPSISFGGSYGEHVPLRMPVRSSSSHGRRRGSTNSNYTAESVPLPEFLSTSCEEPNISFGGSCVEHVPLRMPARSSSSSHGHRRGRTNSHTHDSESIPLPEFLNTSYEEPSVPFAGVFATSAAAVGHPEDNTEGESGSGDVLESTRIEEQSSGGRLGVGHFLGSFIRSDYFNILFRENMEALEEEEDLSIEELEASRDLERERLLREMRSLANDEEEGINQPEMELLAPEAAILPEQVAGTNMADCCVCLGEIEVGDRTRTLPCTHCLHRDCIDTWVKDHSRCPLCRADIRGTEINTQ